MKILTGIFCIVSISCFSQVVTTADEYNYLTKGLKGTLEEGRDAKTGYTLQEVSPIKNESGGYTFWFRPFIKNDTKQIVALSVVLHSTVWGTNTYYLCVPRNNAELAKLYLADLRKLDVNVNKAYAEITSLLLADAIGSLPVK